MNDSAILQIVREGFEEQKGVKILSLYFSDDKRIEGIYIIPPQQSLSFLQLPLLDMATELEEYNIILIELGELLRYSYNMGSLFHFDKLLHMSEIDYANDLFDELIDTCRKNPPLLLIKTNFIEWIELTDDAYPQRTQTFIKNCQKFNKLDNLNFNEDLNIENSASVINQFNDVKQQLKDKKYKKVTELTMNKIDKIFIQMQIDLYTTDVI